METILAIENLESRCNTCSKHCKGICQTCGRTFCSKHILLHAGEGCIEYLEVIRRILWGEFTESKTGPELVSGFASAAC